MGMGQGIDSAQAWRVAFASSALVATSFGTIYSFGAFFDAMALEFDAGLGSVSIVFGITAFLFFGTGAVTGGLADRWGARPLIWVGGAMFAIGLYATSKVGALWQGYFTCGIGAGLGGGLFNSSLFAMAAGWFDRHRGIAQGVVATGSGIGTLILVPVVGRIIDQQGWRQAFVILAILAAVTFFLGGIFVKRPPIEPPPVGSDHLREVLATPAFRRLGICAVLQQGSMLAAFAFIVPFATDRGVSSGTAAVLVGLVGGSSIVGRLFLTGFANRLGPVRMLQLSFLVQPLAFVIWWLADGRVGGLVVFVLVLGVAYGGFVALLPLVTAHLFGVRGLGSVMGWVFLTGAVGSLILPAAVGFVADAVATQTVPILVVAAISATGAATMLGLERDPIELRLTSAAT